MTSTNGQPVGPRALRLESPLLRPEQAAELLAVRTSWVYEAVRTNRLPCLGIGRRIRFTARDARGVAAGPGRAAGRQAADADVALRWQLNRREPATPAGGVDADRSQGESKAGPVG
jgi:excisionase family DNA binding protein